MFYFDGLVGGSFWWFDGLVKHLFWWFGGSCLVRRQWWVDLKETLRQTIKETQIDSRKNVGSGGLISDSKLERDSSFVRSFVRSFVS